MIYLYKNNPNTAKTNSSKMWNRIKFSINGTEFSYFLIKMTKLYYLIKKLKNSIFSIRK